MPNRCSITPLAGERRLPSLRCPETGLLFSIDPDPPCVLKIGDSPMKLSISPNGRRFLRPDGAPFFYLADTAWELFHLLTKDEAHYYLERRAAQKFTVIQAVILAEFDGLRRPNAEGNLPFVNEDPTRPNEAYFEHVDWVLQAGVKLGLTWGLLPTWGDKWNQAWGSGPEVFNPENARIYGEFLGKRYRTLPLIWITGGDRPIRSERDLDVIRATAEGLRAGDAGEHLITFHPGGGRTSSTDLHREEWLDFNTLQSGHTSGRFWNDRMIEHDFALLPVKPCLDSEPPYEDHPDIGRDAKLPPVYFDEEIVRLTAYQALFSGAAGHTYGCHDIWQFFDGVRPSHNRARTPWREALELPGAWQMQHLRALFESLPFETMLPVLDLVVAPARFALVDPVSGTSAVYFPNAATIRVRRDKFVNQPLVGEWFDPRTGLWSEATISEEGNATPPHAGDWVLIVRPLGVAGGCRGVES